MENQIIWILLVILVFVLGAVQIALSKRFKFISLILPLAVFLTATISTVIYLLPIQREMYELIFLFSFNLPTILLLMIHIITRLWKRTKSK